MAAAGWRSVGIVWAGFGLASDLAGGLAAELAHLLTAEGEGWAAREEQREAATPENAGTWFPVLGV